MRRTTPTIPIAAASFLALLPQALHAQPLPPAPAGVQVTTQYGIEFSTVGAPGNASTLAGWTSGEPRPVGSVPYTYRIARTELSNAQWYEFVQAYAPHYSGNPYESQFNGGWIDYTPSAGFSLSPGSARLAAAPSWYMTARYCNWLHNGKINEAWAFESGAYDTSTFATAPLEQPIRDQPAHSPGAKFWIPTQDEWVKAGFYDPNKNGSGLGDYWLYPNASDLAPIPGPAGDPLATTNAGFGGNFIMPTASYPNAQSPWGLFDISGGESEWTGTLRNPGYQRNRIMLGSVHGDSSFIYTDRLEWVASDIPSGDPLFSTAGIRIAATIPTPAATLPLTIALLTLRTRRRRALLSNLKSQVLPGPCGTGVLGRR